MKTKPVVYEKTWGTEEWVCNSEDRGYCGKRLLMYPQSRMSRGCTSYHYHEEKDEHFFVVAGVMKLHVGTKEEVQETYWLKPGDVFHIAPGVVHQIIAEPGSLLEVFEFSTYHREEDSYRIPLPEVKNA